MKKFGKHNQKLLDPYRKRKLLNLVEFLLQIIRLWATHADYLERNNFRKLKHCNDLSLKLSLDIAQHFIKRIWYILHLGTINVVIVSYIILFYFVIDLTCCFPMTCNGKKAKSHQLLVVLRSPTWPQANSISNLTASQFPHHSLS